MRNQQIIETRLVCPKCGNIQTIYRKARSRKKYGHLKMLWCYKCKKRLNHFEICDEQIGEESYESSNK